MLTTLFLTYAGALHSMRYVVARYARAVGAAAEGEGVDPETLFALIALEQLQRGGLLRVLERCCAWLCPALLVRRDCTLGLTQIRISQAQRLLEAEPREVVRQLTNDSENIRVCARMLRAYESEHSLQALPASKRAARVAELHLTGKLGGPRRPRVVLYGRLLAYSIRSGLFQQLAAVR
jgi:hypothetical protein